MARNDTDVSLDDMRTFSMHAVALRLSILQGQSRPLIQCLNHLFKAYEGTQYAKDEHECLDIRIDLARVVVSQSVKHHQQSALIERLKGIMTAFNTEADFNLALGRQSKEDQSLLSDACDQYTRLGLMQFRNVCDSLGVFIYDKASDILLENSIVCTDRQSTTPGIYNDVVPYNFFAAYVASKHVRDYEVARKKEATEKDRGPSL